MDSVNFERFDSQLKTAEVAGLQMGLIRTDVHVDFRSRQVGWLRSRAVAAKNLDTTHRKADKSRMVRKHAQPLTRPMPVATEGRGGTGPASKTLNIVSCQSTLKLKIAEHILRI